MKIASAFLLFASMLLPILAFADECPADGETVQTISYQSATSCPIGRVVIDGRRNPDKYASCLGLVPATEEHVSIESARSSRRLPRVNDLIAKDSSLSVSERNDFVGRIWMASDVKCDGDKIHITYWGGGNCDGCERQVTYQFSPSGRLVSERLRVFD